MGAFVPTRREKTEKMIDDCTLISPQPMPHREYDVFLEASKAPLRGLTLAPSQLAKGVLKIS